MGPTPRDTTSPDALGGGLRTDRHRDLVGRRREPRVRRTLVAALTLAVAAAASGAIGQQERVVRAAGPRAELAVHAPSTLRGGLLVPARIEVRARERIRAPELVLADGWASALQVNTIIPAPAEERSEEGRIVLSYDAVDRGDRLVVRFQFQVDATAVGRDSLRVDLRDGREPLATTRGTVTFLP